MSGENNAAEKISRCIGVHKIIFLVESQPKTNERNETHFLFRLLSHEVRNCAEKKIQEIS